MSIGVREGQGYWRKYNEKLEDGTLAESDNFVKGLTSHRRLWCEGRPEATDGFLYSTCYRSKRSYACLLYSLNMRTVTKND